MWLRDRQKGEKKKDDENEKSFERAIDKET